VIRIDPSAHNRVEHCRQAIAAHPDSPAAHLNMGTALLHTGMKGEAEREFHRALELRPDFPEALVNLGGLLLARWDFRGCVEANRRAAAARPELMIAHYNEGLGHLYLGEADAVVACFGRALALQPDHAASHYHLAVGLLATGAVAESRAHLDMAVEGGYSPMPEFLKALEKAEDDSQAKEEPAVQARA
jgi:tetratricopeptide (TPR) repeat protein